MLILFIRYISRFRHPDYLRGEAGYYLTNLVSTGMIKKNINDELIESFRWVLSILSKQWTLPHCRYQKRNLTCKKDTEET